ncbi:MAG: hypothetical protein FWB85_02910 [Chitinispirillia bacterium]|nr:hypothetical protein [Chitinispirillia bacterium]
MKKHKILQWSLAVPPDTMLPEIPPADSLPRSNPLVGEWREVSSTDKELIEIMNMDPLENTPYEWF